MEPILMAQILPITSGVSGLTGIQSRTTRPINILAIPYTRCVKRLCMRYPPRGRVIIFVWMTTIVMTYNSLSAKYPVS
jgi:hypothetical protein